MELTDQEKQTFMAEVKKEFLKELKRRAVERLFSDCNSRVEHYYAKVSAQLGPELEKELPL